MIPREFKGTKELKEIILGHLEAIDDGLLDVTIDGAVGETEFDVLNIEKDKEWRYTIHISRSKA